jgi:hypothetical protein
MSNELAQLCYDFWYICSLSVTYKHNSCQLLSVRLDPPHSFVLVLPSHVIPTYGIAEDANGGPRARVDEEASSNSVHPKSHIHEPTRGHLKVGLDCNLPTSSSRSHHPPYVATR